MKIAIDFDGTLFGWVERGWSGAKPAGEANTALIAAVRQMRANGHKLILWTCREGDDLESAVQACRSYGLEFDAVNSNLPETIDGYMDSRKIVADLYIDDRAINPKSADSLLWAMLTKGTP